MKEQETEARPAAAIGVSPQVLLNIAQYAVHDPVRVSTGSTGLNSGDGGHTNAHTQRETVTAVTIVLIAFGLAMDAFAVSVASGFAIKKLRVSHALRIAVFFGSFQAFMPIAGWCIGANLRNLIASFDHWIAFLLLAGIGGKMIYESTMLDSNERNTDTQRLSVLLMLSFATSIDALAVGFSLSLLHVGIVTPAVVIGATAFLCSFAGVYIGDRCGHFFEKKIEVAGGLLLIGIGLKILLQHLGS